MPLVADLYIILFDSIVDAPDKTGHGWEGFYFGENGEHSWYEISKAIGDALVKLGLTDEAEPTPFTVEELVNYFGSEKAGWYSGTNSRCRANRRPTRRQARNPGLRRDPGPIDTLSRAKARH